MNEHFIAGKDASLEVSISRMQSELAKIGFHVEERSWLNPIGGVWSVHVADRDCPLLFSNGKGSSQLAARASALGEFIERLSTNYFWSHYYLGEEFAGHRYTHHPDERWFAVGEEDDAVARVGVGNRGGNVGAARFHVVVGADADRSDLLLRADHMFGGDEKLGSEASMRDQHQTEHVVVRPYGLPSVPCGAGGLPSSASTGSESRLRCCTTGS